MSAKLDRIGEERDKALRRRDEWDARYKELDKRYREQENTEIHDLVHAFNLTPGTVGTAAAPDRAVPSLSGSSESGGKGGCHG